jgi:hypothetical protein
LEGWCAMTPVQRLRGVAYTLDNMPAPAQEVANQLRLIVDQMLREQRDADFRKQVWRMTVVCLGIVVVLYFLVTRCLP